MCQSPPPHFVFRIILDGWYKLVCCSCLLDHHTQRFVEPYGASLELVAKEFNRSTYLAYLIISTSVFSSGCTCYTIAFIFKCVSPTERRGLFSWLIDFKPQPANPRAVCVSKCTHRCCTSLKLVPL